MGVRPLPEPLCDGCFYEKTQIDRTDTGWSVPGPCKRCPERHLRDRIFLAALCLALLIPVIGCALTRWQ